MREPVKDPVDLGQVAYEAYCDYVNWKSVQGEELPGFSQQKPRLQNAWRLAAEAAAPHLAAAERTALCETLTGHYLAAITCDHERKQDRPECACSLVDLGWHPSVGEAVQAWIRHVMWRRSADLATEQP